jgi:hypothetical protein
MGLLQEPLRRYCLILRKHKTGSSQAETSGRRDIDLPAGETSGAKRVCEQKPKVRFAAIVASVALPPVPLSPLRQAIE